MNKKGIAPALLGMGALVIVGVIILALVFLSSYIRWIVIGIAILVGFVWLLGQAFKSDAGFTRGKVIALLVFLGIGLFFILGAGVLQTTFAGDRYVEIPVFASIECKQLGPANFPTLPLKTEGKWISDSFPMNTNEWGVKVITPDKRGLTLYGYQLEYYICNSRNFNDCPIHETDSVSVGGDIVNLGIESSTRHIWMQYQKTIPFVSITEASGAEVQITYKPFVLVRDDVFRGGRHPLDENLGCTVPTSDFGWKNRILSFVGSENINTYSGDNKLEPGDIFNYPTGNILAVSEGNTQSGGWCIYENNVGNIYEIEKITTASGTYNKVNLVNRIGITDCCNKATYPTGVICQNGKLIKIEDKECEDREDCGSLEWNAVLDTAFTAQRATCVNNKCGFETKTVDCTKNTDCKTNEFCSRNTFTCKLSSDSPDLDEGVEREEDEDKDEDSNLQCGWWENSFEVQKEDCGTLGYKKIFNACKPYTESGCRTTGWIYVVIGGMVLIIIVVLMIPRKQNGEKKKK